MSPASVDDLDFKSLVEQLVKAHKQEVDLLRAELSKGQKSAESRNEADTPRGSHEQENDSGSEIIKIENGVGCTDGRSGKFENDVASTCNRKAHRMITALRPQKKLRLGNMYLTQTQHQSQLQKFVLGPLDVVTSSFILLNAVLMAIQCELSGLAIDRQIAKQDVPQTLNKADQVCTILDNIFTVCFFLELMLRISILRTSFFWSWDLKKFKSFNVFDTVVVLGTCLEMFVNSIKGNLAFIRVVRLLRLTRSLRLTRMLGYFSPFRVLVATVLRSFSALFWTMVLLFFIMFIAAVTLCQTLQPYMVDGPEALSEGDRRELFSMYGTFGQAIVTMFKMTFSGCWPAYANKVLEVHPAYVFFFGIYVSVVIFACTRIVTALFLRDTLKAAESDADMMVAETLEKKRTYLRKLHELFCMVDSSGDGQISIEEFEAVIGQPQVRAYLELLDITFAEVENLFNLLEGGSGSISHHDFLQGILRLKGQARAMDIVTLMRETHKVQDVCKRIERLCEPKAQPSRYASM